VWLGKNCDDRSNPHGHSGRCSVSFFTQMPKRLHVPSAESDELTEGGMPDETFAGMVRHLQPSWEPVAFTPVTEGVNSTVVVDVNTPQGDRTVVLKTSTSTHPLAADRARAEPHVLSLVGRETAVPVPSVRGACDDHDTYPAPYVLMEYVEGESFSQDEAPELPSSIRETFFHEAGRNLAGLHDLGPLEAVGDIVGRDGTVTILDTPASPSYDSFHEWLLDSYEETLDELAEDGGYFPELTEQPDRFDDLVPEIRRYLTETVPELSPPGPPTYCHKDYRYGNLVVTPETGATRAVLDWANLMAAPPGFNLAIAESKLLKPDLNTDADASTGRAGELRRVLWDAYESERDGWQFDEATRERIRVYRLAYRLDAMACLPLFAQIDPTLDDRETRAAEHRAFVEQYL
jgi:aminoglycoside phosphotransferase (APT) family kinase protein